jgi:hypothetical protein
MTGLRPCEKPFITANRASRIVSTASVIGIAHISIHYSRSPMSTVFVTVPLSMSSMQVNSLQRRNYHGKTAWCKVDPDP